MSLEIVSFLVGIAGILFVVYPRTSISPGDSLNSHDPFKTPFIIKNDGYLPLFNVTYSLTAERMETVDGSTFLNSGGSITNNIEKLDQNKSSALFMDRIFSLPPNYVKFATIFIHITYRPFLVPFTFTEKIRFKAERKNTGEYIWLESYAK